MDVGIWFTDEEPGPDLIRALWGELEDAAAGAPVDLVMLNTAAPQIAWEAMQGLPLVVRDRGFLLETLLAVSREAEDAREFVLDFWRWREAIRARRSAAGGTP